MKKFGPFLGGVVTGVVITLLGLIIFASSQKNSSADDAIYFDKPSDALSERSFKVFQVLDKGVALVNGESDSKLDLYYGPVYMLVNHDNKYYSDDEIISLESDEEARKVGVFNYKTQGNMEKTVSIIAIMK